MKLSSEARSRGELRMPAQSPLSVQVLLRVPKDGPPVRMCLCALVVNPADVIKKPENQATHSATLTKQRHARPHTPNPHPPPRPQQNRQLNEQLRRRILYILCIDVTIERSPSKNHEIASRTATGVFLGRRNTDKQDEQDVGVLLYSEWTAGAPVKSSEQARISAHHQFRLHGRQASRNRSKIHANGDRNQAGSYANLCLPPQKKRRHKTSRHNHSSNTNRFASIGVDSRSMQEPKPDLMNNSVAVSCTSCASMLR